MLTGDFASPSTIRGRANGSSAKIGVVFNSTPKLSGQGEVVARGLMDKLDGLYAKLQAEDVSVHTICYVLHTGQKEQCNRPK